MQAMAASHVPSDNHSGSMPSLFSSNSSSRSWSLPESRRNSTPGPYIRRGTATLDALTRSLRKKSEVEVVLDGKDEFVRTYSTFDQIKGHVELKFEKDTLIGDMIIVFEGQCQTYVEKLASASPSTGRTTGRHTFLRVQQPISQSSLPENNLAKANTLYTIPFTFVVPDRLLPHVCSHKVDHEEVRKAHLRLPPSIGDPMLAGEGNVLMDDLAPEMAKVSYHIKTKVGKASASTGKLIDIEEKLARIRIVPVREEEPPLPVDDDNQSYTLRKEKNVRKGVFKIGKKLGRLTAEAAQPKSLRLPAPACTSKAPVTTMASVMLRFDPASEQEQPPQLHNLAAKLKVYTFFGAAAYKIIPEVSRCDNWSTLHGVYPENVPLSSRNIGSVTWTKHDPGCRAKSTSSSGSEFTRRDSSFSDESTLSSSSSASIPTASEAYDSSLPFYTAKVLVPASLPRSSESEETSQASTAKPTLSRGSRKIIFTPTFHTCIISRTYTLELCLSFHPVTANGSSNALSASSITLRTPIQISQEGSSLPPTDTNLDLLSAGYDMALVEGTDEYDEAMARHLDHQLNFTNPFSADRRIEETPEYEEVEMNSGPQRHASIAVPPSASQGVEQPPEYYSPFRSSGAGVPQAGGRRVSIMHESRQKIARSIAAEMN